MYLTELDVVNDMIGTMGESPLNALDEDHPLVASAIRVLRTANAREQGKGWWFNTDHITLAQDADGNVYVPADALSADPLSPFDHLVQRGRRFFNPYSNSNGFNIGRDVPAKIIRLIPFADLPAQAQTFVACSAVLDFQKAYDADDAKTRILMNDRSEAFVVLNAENIRNQNTNLLNTVWNATHSLGTGLGRTGRVHLKHRP